MSGIFGLFHRRGAPIEPAALRAMEEAMSFWGPDGRGSWHDGPIGLGQMLLFNTPEALYERLPRWLPEPKLAFTAEARIDNRDELCDQFAVAPLDRPFTSDGDLILKAYLKWGEQCPDHLLGDWSFAVWNSKERRLFLARDHHGNTSLYYFCDGSTFAFASSLKALLALPQVPRKIDELRIAQILTAWHGDGVQTAYEAISRVPPSHTIAVTSEEFSKRRYWRLEEIPMLPSRTDESYIDGFLDVYSTAVRSRLRTHRPAGATLSGGLDSGSVAAVAARELRSQGRRLQAMTSVPLYDVANKVGRSRLGDESALSKATADFAGNVEHTLIRSENVSHLSGLRSMLDIHDSPAHAVRNQYWIVSLMEAARSLGLGTLLTGQGGNATISWAGWHRDSRLKPLFRERDYRNIITQKIVRPVLPSSLVRRLRILKRTGSWKLSEQPWLAYSGIHESFARQIGLAARMEEAGHDPYFLDDWTDSHQARWAIIKPGRAGAGSLWAEIGAAFGLEVRDPTLDKRVIDYCFGLPEHLFLYEKTIGRGLIRRAMIGYLPDIVRLNRHRGVQGADIGERIKRESSEALSILDRLAASPDVCRILDVDRIAASLRSIEARADQVAARNAIAIFLGGVAAGIFLAGQENRMIK